MGRWFACLLLAIIAVFLAVQMWYFAHILYWTVNNPASSRFMELRLEAQRDKNPKARLAHNWVEYRNISVHLKRAIIVAEDAKFMDHEGFDWDGIQRALDKNQKKGAVVAGGSTISQQLAKNLFLSGERTWLRKGQEALITAMLEIAMDKRRIFEIYMNVVEWGEGVFGAEAAARHYFGVQASRLTPAQAARLAAMLPRPRFFQRNPGSNYLAEYSATILSRMPQARVP
ncbi:MAG: monofunctional biosynthetic peptidoglycan transglycosylase [Betaproteobacteria bacterium RIFCSPLOWO2_02_FULL_62_17]|nr:MAG: monofunctional biosynthetic peptidoglycan transglycosylase [Betaproteobacteria bacterium RIFCSPLOWO2_02_FULL_62_17]